MTVFLQQPHQQPPQDTYGGSSSRAATAPEPAKKEMGFFKAFTSRGKEKATASANAALSAPTTAQPQQPPQPPRMTNVFSLVERFAFSPNHAESNSPNLLPFLPQEIQYWAGVIMRNACLKDEGRGGVRQCARSE